MREIANMILDGTMCEECGMLVYEGDPKKATKEELSPGYPRHCKDCKGEDIEEQYEDD